MDLIKHKIEKERKKRKASVQRFTSNRNVQLTKQIIRVCCWQYAFSGSTLSKSSYCLRRLVDLSWIRRIKMFPDSAKSSDKIAVLLYDYLCGDLNIIFLLFVGNRMFTSRYVTLLIMCGWVHRKFRAMSRIKFQSQRKGLTFKCLTLSCIVCNGCAEDMKPGVDRLCC